MKLTKSCVLNISKFEITLFSSIIFSHPQLVLINNSFLSLIINSKPVRGNPIQFLILSLNLTVLLNEAIPTSVKPYPLTSGYPSQLNNSIVESLINPPPLIII